MTNPNLETETKPPKVAGIRRWLSFTVLAGVLALNAWEYGVSLQAKPELRRLKEVQAFKEGQQKQILAWKTKSEIASRKFISDRQSLFSMYQQCQSLEDLFVVYPDMLVSSFKRKKRGFELRFYLPPGTHKLKAGIGPEMIQPRSEGEIGGFTKLFELEGGRKYQITATVTDQSERGSELHFQMSDHETIKLPLKKGELDGEAIKDEKERLWLPFKTDGGPSDGISNVGRMRLLDYRWMMKIPGSATSKSLRLFLEFETKGVPRWSAGDPEILRTMIAIAKNESELEDMAESRRYDEAEGAYYKKQLSKNKKLNTIDW